MLKDAITTCIQDALDRAVASGDLPPEASSIPQVERTRNPLHGDYATNVAMLLAKPVRRAPAQIAGVIAGHIALDGMVAKVAVASPGFLNLTLTDASLRDAVRQAVRKGGDYGKSPAGKGEKVLIEYVSANPTGPLHVGHGRWAVLGSTLAAVMAWAGWDVRQEFYINDFGNQLLNLGRSIHLRLHEQPFPEDVKDLYAGPSINDLADRAKTELPELAGMAEDAQIARLTEFGRDAFLAQQQAVLGRLGVRFDRWFSERDLHSRGEVSEALDVLLSKGEMETREGALWLLSSRHGDGEDRVVVRSDGRPTYLAADVAYHRDKFQRGFDRLINLWGADHHGYVARMKAAVACLGHDPARLEVILGQLVKLYRGGVEVKMSKRTGEMVTIEDVMDEVGVDATRYFLVARGADTPIDFDLDLAKKESADNPVFYVQYAHARISSIFRTGREAGQVPEDLSTVDLSPLVQSDERKLMLALAQFPDEIVGAALTREPHRIARYAQDLATDFHSFYTNCRVLNEAEPDLTRARLALVGATRIVLRNALEGLLGISAPERM